MKHLTKCKIHLDPFALTHYAGRREAAPGFHHGAVEDIFCMHAGIPTECGATSKPSLNGPVEEHSFWGAA